MKSFLRIVGYVCLALIAAVIALSGWYTYKTSDTYRNRVTHDAVLAADPEICNALIQRFPVPEHPREDCITQVAIGNSNPDVCDQITDPGFESESCYTKVAISEGNPKICDRIDAQGSSRNSCREKVEEGLR